MATRTVAAMRANGPIWAVGLLALAALLGAMVDVPSGITWT
ncbi:hypothetical protein [Sphaerisporangium corydalis]|uniref:Uncharacterized protein n=1 Tax=Sphaerisporangium corydalis TaxID=1441875 RepID=A0ABV9EEZ4_9ACTN|nr:hypothetical protein [Sphaerisporangium corydalis]